MATMMTGGHHTTRRTTGGHHRATRTTGRHHYSQDNRGGTHNDQDKWGAPHGHNMATTMTGTAERGTTRTSRGGPPMAIGRVGHHMATTTTGGVSHDQEDERGTPHAP
jgi:hypothetical protein